MSKFVLTAEIKMRGPSASEMNAVAAQIKAGISGVNVPINVEIPPTQQRALKNIANDLKVVRQSAEQTTSSFEQLGQSLSQNIRRYGTFTIATGAFIRLGVAIRKSIGEAIDFETEIRKIAQGQNKAISSFTALKQEIDDLSKSLGVSSLGLASTSRILSQAGLSVNEVKTALEALAKSELAPTFGNINDTTEASIAIMRQFGIQAKELKGILGEINQVSADFAVESEDIAAAVRLGGASLPPPLRNFSLVLKVLDSLFLYLHLSDKLLAVVPNLLLQVLELLRLVYSVVALLSILEHLVLNLEIVKVNLLALLMLLEKYLKRYRIFLVLTHDLLILRSF